MSGPLSRAIGSVRHCNLAVTLSRTSRCSYCGQSEQKKEPKSKKPHGTINRRFIYPTLGDKLALVYSKMYPNLDSIPEYVSEAEYKLAHEIRRIKVNIHMMIFALAICSISIYEGKRDRASTADRYLKAQEEKFSNIRWKHIKGEDAKEEARFQEEVKKFKEEEAAYWAKFDKSSKK